MYKMKLPAFLSLFLVCVVISVPALAATTIPALRCPLQKVVRRQKVPAFTVGLCCVPRLYGVTPECVFAARHRPTVERIAAPAGAIVANVVVQNHPIRDGANLSFVANASDAMRSVANSHHRIPAASSSLPNVTPTLVGNPAGRILSARIPQNESTNHRENITHV